MSFEGLLSFALLGLLILGSLALFIALRPGLARLGPVDPTAAALGRGDFRAVLQTADTSSGAERDSLYAAAVAAKHLLEWEPAKVFLQRILKSDNDGEAWLELGLVQTYEGSYEEARRSFEQVESTRSDLLESLTLHRAFLDLCRCETARAQAQFEEIEAALETKLRTDMGASEPLFCEWFLQSAALWHAMGQETKAECFRELALRTCGESRLAEHLERFFS